jgi:LPLT family lysophospholipid transporter-like MFS transporter
MNACLQQVGHRSVGAGKTIAIQNFFENTFMFAGVGAYTLAARAGVDPNVSLAATGAALLAMVGYLFVYSRRR